MRFFHMPLWQTPPLLAASWVSVMMKQPESWTYRKLDPEWTWSPENQLRAAAVDELRIANWQRTDDGHNNRNQPEPIARPGVGNYVKPGDRPKAVEIEELQEILARPRTAVEHGESVHK